MDIRSYFKRPSQPPSIQAPSITTIGEDSIAKDNEEFKSLETANGSDKLATSAATLPLHGDDDGVDEEPMASQTESHLPHRLPVPPGE